MKIVNEECGRQTSKGSPVINCTVVLERINVLTKRPLLKMMSERLQDKQETDIL